MFPLPKKHEGSLEEILIDPDISPKDKAWTLYLAGKTISDIDKLLEKAQASLTEEQSESSFLKEDSVAMGILEELGIEVP